jgi:hypothetical protein
LSCLRVGADTLVDVAACVGIVASVVAVPDAAIAVANANTIAHVGGDTAASAVLDTVALSGADATGDADLIARIRPIVECYADTIIPCGPLGSALTVKLVNNFVSFSNAVVISETFAAAARLGVDPNALAAMIEAGGANSVMFSWIAPWIREGDDSRGRGKLWMGQNVLETYRGMAKEAGAPTEMADAVSRSIAAATMVGRTRGMVIRQNTCQGLAPSICAAS